MSRYIQWTSSRSPVEVHLHVAGTEVIPRFLLRTSKRLSTKPLFVDATTHDKKPLALAAALLVLLNQKGQVVSAKAVLQALSKESTETFSHCKAEILLPSNHPPLLMEGDTSTQAQKIPALWLQNLEETAADALQKELSLIPGLFIQKDESVISLGHGFTHSTHIHSLPRIVISDQSHIADNTQAALSMGSLLNNFIEQFSEKQENTLSNVSIATGYLYYHGLRRVLGLLQNKQISSLRLLFSGQTDKGSVKALTQLFGEQLHEAWDDESLWKTCTDAVQEGRFEVRVYTRAFLHAKLFLGWRDINKHKFLLGGAGVIGSSNVTRPGLQTLGNLELNITIEEKHQLRDLKRWFDARWEESDLPDPSLMEVMQYTNPISKPPTFITEGLLEVWKAGRFGKLDAPYRHIEMLARFYKQQVAAVKITDLPPYPPDPHRKITPAPEQCDGVLALVHRLLQSRVAFLADSVGLGKTITSLGVAWYMQRLGEAQRVALIAPSKLFEQWKHDTQGISAPSGLLHFVNRHKLERKNPADASKLLDGYDLILVEEAHEALRNRKNKLWVHLREHLRTHKHTRLLLISATPWNNRREDIFNYLLLPWVEGALSTHHSLYPAFAQDPLREHLSLFTKTHSAGAKDFDGLSLLKYRQLFGAAFVQRTRASIHRVYGTKLNFPARQVHPHSASNSPQHEAFFAHLGDALEKLQLPYYLPFLALQRAITRTSNEPGALDKDSNLRGTFIIQLYKRAESSLFALAISLSNIQRRLKTFRDRLEEISKSKDAKEAMKTWLEERYLKLDEESLDEEGEADRERMTPAEKVRYKNLMALMERLTNSKVQAIVKDLIKHEVDSDDEVLKQLIDALTPALGQSAPKARQLLEIARDHYELGHKPLLIGGFADTTMRYFIALCAAIPKARIGLALGGGEGWVRIPGKAGGRPISDQEWSDALQCSDPHKRRQRLLSESGRAVGCKRSELIQRFAPKAQNTPEHWLEEKGVLDILIGSEAISVGQNLQDSTALIQLDLPWNPMIIEQRIGRIDRRGGGRDEVAEDGETQRIVDVHYCWSNAAVEAEVSLRKRLRKKASQAMDDTNFDELLLFELRDKITEIHELRAQGKTVDVQKQLAQVLGKRQEELALKRAQVQGITGNSSGEVDGVRLLASWAKDANLDLKILPAPVVTCASVSGPADWRWLISLGVTPKDKKGHTLSKPFLVHLPISEEQSPKGLESNLEVLFHALEAPLQALRRPDMKRDEWSKTLKHLDQFLQGWGKSFTENHNKEARDHAKKQSSPAAMKTPSNQLRLQVSKAKKALELEMKSRRKETAFIARGKIIKERLVFLFKKALDPNNTHRMLSNDSSEKDLQRALFFVKEQPGTFIMEEESFDLFFHEICGDFYEESLASSLQEQPEQSATQESKQTLFEFTHENGLWESISLEVLGATFRKK